MPNVVKMKTKDSWNRRWCSQCKDESLSKVTTVPPIFELYATPTPQYELLAADAIIPAHFVP